VTEVTADPAFFRDLGYVFVAAVLGALLARVARQPLILGYVVGGILIGPFTPGVVVEDLHTFELFAEIGVILLMFSVGIEFSIRDLLRVKWVALLGGPLGIVLSAVMGAGVGMALGWTPMRGVVVGLIISVASTMVLARLLMDRGELRSEHGRVTIGITLVEDLAVVVLTVLLPSLATLQPERLAAVGAALGRAILILVPFVYLALKVVPRVMTRVARTRDHEFFLIVVLGIGLGTAAFAQAIGLSLALGAFLAGLLISTSDQAHETLERLFPLRDAFVAMFFVTMGALINPATVRDNLQLVALMIGLIVIGKPLIWAAVVRLFGYPLATAALVGVGLTQIGEFSFILVQAARSAGLVGDDVYNATLAASLVTIVINAVLVKMAPRWIESARQRRAATAAASNEPLSGHVVVCGFGRVGGAVGDALHAFGVRYAVIDRNTDIVNAMSERGIPAYAGDAARPEMLTRAGIERATLAVVALPEINSARLAVRAIRDLNVGVEILARGHDRDQAEAMRTDGASHVVLPERETAAALIAQTLSAVALPVDHAFAYVNRFRGVAESTAPSGDAPLPEVREITIGSALADQSLREARIRERFGVTIVAIDRANDVILNPPPEAILRPGDKVRAFGLPTQIAAFVRDGAQP
jgi:monovalent cation:H+ antiporter-2, CPA2 family